MEESDVSDEDEEVYDEGSSSEEESSFAGKEDMSMEDLLKLRDKLGTKAFDKKFIQNSKKSKKIVNAVDNSIKDEQSNNQTRKKFSRVNKNRPQEVSSKRSAGRHSKWKHNTETRDPRFDEICGSKFNQEVFDNRFSFLSDIRAKEKTTLGKKLNKAKSSEEKKRLKYLLNRMNNQEREKRRRNEEKEVVQKWRKEEKEKVSQGKRPYFLKDSDKKKLIKEYRQQNSQDKPKKSKNGRRKFQGRNVPSQTTGAE